MSRFPFLAIAGLLGAAFCEGQTAPAPGDPDPEDRNHGVARISLINGDLSIRRGDSGDFVAGGMNAPLLVQDAVQTGPGARAEVQFDSANRLRLGENAEIRFAELVAGRYQVQIGRGTTMLSVMRDSAAQAEIDTPSVAVRPSGPGEYRITVLEDGTTQITVRSGEARVDGPAGEERLMAGQTMMARGSADNPEFQIVAAIGRDEWDAFNENRDRDLDRADSYRYVSRDIAGAEDLDAYGQWETDPTYGQVWAPRVAADWAPYRSGRWVWEDYYGWTWVSYDPWGWAPYHYGNWFVGARGWCWYPGSRYSHHWFRPALVGFFGFGAGAGGFGFGHVGWVPLAPFETFHRWYGRGFGSGYRGLGGGVNVEASYRNARFPNGVTAIGAQEFANGRFGRYTSVGANELRQASVFRGAVPVSPTSGSLRFNDRQTGVTGRSAFGQTRFAGHNQPSQTGRTPFGGPAASRSTQPGGNPGWQRFGSPASQGTVGRSFVQPSGPRRNETAWGRFGAPAGGISSQPSAQTQGPPSWQRFGPVNSARGSARPSTPQPSYRSAPSRPVQVAPPIVRERSSQAQPSYRSSPAPARSAPSRSVGGNGGGSSSRGSSSHGDSHRGR